MPLSATNSTGSASQLPVGLFKRAQSQQIVGGIARGGSGEDVAHQQRQAGVMAEIERGSARSRMIEAGERFRDAVR